MKMNDLFFSQEYNIMLVGVVSGDAKKRGDGYLLLGKM